MSDLPPPGDYRSTDRYGYSRQRAAAWYRVIALIWFVAGVIDVLIAARFLGLLFGASPASAFVSLIYGVTAPLVAPFEGIFGTPAAGAHVFETADLIAIIVYLLIALALVTLIRILSGRRRPDAT
jgi:uncharacterized protein YggT (Ycf19 family)